MMRVELLDRLRMMHGKTVVNCDFSEYIRYIESTQTENAALKEQITNAKYNYLGAMADCKRYEETIEQQAEAIRLKDAALDWCIGEFNLRLDDIDLSQETIRVLSARHIQHSPETLQARDERVAEACAKAVIAYNGGQCDAHVLASQLICGEWRKHI